MYNVLISRLREHYEWTVDEWETPIMLSGDLKEAADAIEELSKKYLASEVDNTNLTGWLAEEHVRNCPHYIRNVHDRGDDSLCDKYVCEVKDVPHWIPVTERLPEKPDGYPHCQIRRTYFLVALESGCVKTLGYEFDRNEWQIVGSPVVAWMPLPEPYEPPKEDE